MTQDETIDKLLFQAGASFGGDGINYEEFNFRKFAKLVAAKERETCAKVCDELVNKENSCDYQDAANWCSIRIRARGQA